MTDAIPQLSHNTAQFAIFGGFRKKVRERNHPALEVVENIGQIV
jgi:hypothetical protein